MHSDGTGRRFELDWIRVMATLAVFLYHSTRFFNLGDWHIKDSTTFVWVEIWNRFATIWIMPLFFVISGAGLFFTLKHANGFKRFYTGKFSRLMVPVLLATVTHSALQIYLERVTHGQFTGSFFSFLPTYFSGLYLFIGSAGNYAFHGMHLWFLLFLFLYSLLCYPLFKWMQGGGQGIVQRITGITAHPGWIIPWFAIPLLVVKWGVPPGVAGIGSGGWGFVYYIWFLVAGFIIVSSHRMLHCIKQSMMLSMVLAILLSTMYLYGQFIPVGVSLPVPGPWGLSLLRCLSVWAWIFTFLGAGMRYLSFDHPVLGQLNEGVLPFYILHQTILLMIGYLVIPLEIHTLLKWSVITLGSFLVIVGVYWAVIRPVNMLRFFFGMKTAHPFYNLFKRPVVSLLPLLVYIGMIMFAAMNPSAGFAANRSPKPIVFDKNNDIVLNSRAITHDSGTGVAVINDSSASTGQAIEFDSGASPTAMADPEVFVDLGFGAPAGRYLLWVRGRCDTGSVYSDSVWVQADHQIGTSHGRVLGNWQDIHPAGSYAWAGNSMNPVAILLRYSGSHILRIQPRQTPHRIDQIWLSRSQQHMPDTSDPIR
ncbi:MAG: acyltransferase [Desulfobacteraceae bacterium]|nr:MAG: acyltransferase [Desulfobacteraceae bacterium]